MVGMKAKLSFWRSTSYLSVLVEHRDSVVNPIVEALLRGAFPTVQVTNEIMPTGNISTTLWLPCTLDSLHPVVVGAVRALRDVGIDAEVSP